MNTLQARGWKVLAMTVAVTVTIGAAAQTNTVIGTGNPERDVAAVQAAVDQGGSVKLVGNFNFDKPPSKPAGAIYNRMVTISREVAISGMTQDPEIMTTIYGGELPFAVDAPGARVTIEGLRFARPKAAAINVYAVSGLVIAHCKIVGVQALPDAAVKGGLLANGIFVGYSRSVPTATQPGKPANFSGTLAVLENDIDMEGAPNTSSLGVVMFAVGESPGSAVDVYVSGNHIKNTTEPAINFRYIGGRAHAVRNVVSTGAVAGADPDVVRVVGSGSYSIDHNRIECAWATGGGIHVAGQVFGPEMHAMIAENEITMSGPEGTTFDAGSAAIEIIGYAQDNVVLDNKLRGRSGAAITITDQGAGIPANNTLVMNDLTGFHATSADIVIDVGVSNTQLVGQKGSVIDNGTGTTVVTTHE